MSKKNKVGLYIIFIIIISNAVAFSLGLYGNDDLKELKEQDILSPDLQAVEDGTYTGTYYYTDTVYTTVEVTVINHEITDIVVLEDLTSRADRVADLPAQMIEDQTWDIDGVSGATISSLLLIHAVEDAIAVEHPWLH